MVIGGWKCCGEPLQFIIISTTFKSMRQGVSESPVSLSVPVGSVKQDDILTRDLEPTPPSGHPMLFTTSRAQSHTHPTVYECTEANTNTHTHTKACADTRALL